MHFSPMSTTSSVGGHLSTHREGTGLLDLPIEIRFHIYRYILPSRQELDIASPCKNLEICMVNRSISKETYAILYGENVFKIKVTDEDAPKRIFQRSSSMSSSGHGGCGQVLRNLRSIRLMVITNGRSQYLAVRLRARLDDFTNTLTAYADDNERRSLLNKLSIEYITLQEYVPDRTHLKPNEYGENRRHLKPSEFGKYGVSGMFVLEPLVGLKRIDSVEVTGTNSWLRSCLEMCIKGEGGELEKVDWLVKKTRRKARKGRYGTEWRYREESTRRYYQPTLDWRAFALRNEIPYGPEAYDFLFRVVKLEHKIPLRIPYSWHECNMGSPAR